LEITVVTLNINGVHRKAQELSAALLTEQVDVLLLQETLLAVGDRRLQLPGFKCFNAPAELSNAAGDRGQATAVRKSLSAQVLPEFTKRGCLVVRIFPSESSPPFLTVNVYVPHRAAAGATLKHVRECVFANSTRRTRERPSCWEVTGTSFRPNSGKCSSQ
jgi:exonuclease III